MATKKVTVEVSAEGLSAVLKLAERLNNTLDQAEKPRKIRAASAALSASEPQNTGLTRGTAAGKGRGDARDFGREAQGLGGLVHLYATFAANIYAVSAAFSALSKAADFTNMEKASEILSTKLGVSIKGIAKDMQALTDGAINMSDALGSASLASSAGLTTTQIKELTTVAKGASIALGRDMTDALQRVFRGTIKIEPELLDELGLMVKVDDANKAYAKTLSKTVSTLTDYERRQAFVNAVTTQGISKYKELADQAANPFSKLLASIHNLGTGILTTINSALGPFISMLSISPTALLVGLGAIVSLLLKQAVPAITNMRAAWEAQDQVAQKALTNQIAAINERKKAIAAEKAAQLKASQVDLVATTAALEGTLSNKLKGKKEFVSSMRALTWVGLDQAQIDEAAKQGSANIDKLVKELQGKIDQKQNKINATKGILGSTGPGYDTDKQLRNAERYVEVLKDQKNAAETLARAQLSALSVSAGQAATAEAAVRRQDENLQKLLKEEKLYDRIAKNRGALSAAYSKGDTLGFISGFKELNTQLESIESNNGRVVQGYLRLKGTLGLLTVSVSKLLGTFSIWGAAIAVAIPIAGYFATKMGLTNDKLKNATESSAKLNESLKLQNDISEKMSRSGSLAEMYESASAAAQNYVEVLKNLKNSLTDLQAFKEQKGASGFLDKAVESFSGQFFNSGIGGKEENQATLDEFIKNIQTNKGFSEKYGNLIPKGEKAEDTLNWSSKTNTDLNTRLVFIEEMKKANIEAMSISSIEAEKLADSYKSLSQNLKEVDTLSNEYMVSLTNQSKELKTLSAFSSATKNLYTQLAYSKKPMVEAGYFISSITAQFQEMSGVALSSNLSRVSTSLSSIKEEADAFYEANTRGLGNSTADNERRKQEEEKRNITISSGTATALRSGGYYTIQDFQVDISKHGLKVAESLANLAAASTRAAIAQAKISKNLRTTQFFGGLSQSNSAIVKAAEYAAERKKADIEIRGEKSNISSIKTQQGGVKDMLKFTIDTAMKAIQPDSLSGLNPIPLKAKDDIGRAKELLADRRLYSNNSVIAGQLLDLINQLTSLGTAAEIASGKIVLINEGVTDPTVVAADTKLTAIESAAETAKQRAQLEYDTNKTILQLKQKQAKPLSSSLTDDATSYDLNKLDAEYEVTAATQELKKLQDSFLDKIQDTNTTINDNNIRDAATQIELANSLLEQKTISLSSIEQDRLLVLIEERAQQTSNISELMGDQIELQGKLAELVLSSTTNYSTLLDLSSSQLSTTKAQLEVEKSIMDTKVATLQKIINSPIASDLAKSSASLEQMKLEQNFLSKKIDIVQKVTDLYKEQHDLKLKEMEAAGKWKEIFTGEGLQEAATIMVNRIEETMGKSKSAMSQLATGLVDAADTIVDSFSTMIQKMDETKVTWVAFRDMVRNTLSDMFRDMASDMLKNQVKKLMLSTLKYFNLNTESDSEKTAKELGLKITDNIEALKNNTLKLQQLIESFKVSTPPREVKEPDWEARFKEEAVLDKTTNGIGTGTGVETFSIPKVDTIVGTPINSTLSYTPKLAEDMLSPAVAAAMAEVNASDESTLLNELKFNNREISADLDRFLKTATDSLIARGIMPESSTPTIDPRIPGIDNSIENTADKISEAGDTFQNSAKEQVLAATSFTSAIETFGITTNSLASAATSILTGSSVQSVSKSLLPSVFKTVLGSFMGAATTTSSMFASQQAGFTAAELNSWGGAMFAKGGIMSNLGEIPLHKYARGGIASSPQMALFGEGSKNEAYVPLPDNRSIPVTLSGGSGTSMGDVNISISINNSDSGTSTSIDVDQAKKMSSSMASSIKAVVQEELMKQMRPRGLLHG